MRKPLPKGPEGPPGSLAAALANVPDPRRPYGWRPEYPPIPLVALLLWGCAHSSCSKAAGRGAAGPTYSRFSADVPEGRSGSTPVEVVKVSHCLLVQRRQHA